LLVLLGVVLLDALLAIRGCRRVATHVSQLADTVVHTAAKHIVVARLDCAKHEAFCENVIKIQRTPEFKVCESCGRS
jgi:hypothetical protein